RRLALDTSKNILIHFFVERALIAASLNQGPDLNTPKAWLKERVRRASKLFKHEFRFKADAAFDEIFEAALQTLVSEGLLAETAGHLRTGVGSSDWSAAQWLVTFSNILRNFFEGYRVAARSLSLLLTGP